ncbi:mitochondrial import inner membrane translocase subunit tim44 [Plakobranchus ocellatus]|uniref:Mitochondrial import inner membrane translocase subunit tim44 n=1 Tax=Plakobranchus ocellatus TaxID=259542 RepID=A0AAV4E2Q2_9GAST|nr:mitochondrial import inner membrane translocase subunit tim44 [Plakobranchus ocellatus]
MISYINMASMHRIIGTIGRVTCQTGPNAPSRIILNRTLKTDTSKLDSSKINTIQVPQRHVLLQNYWPEMVTFQQRYMSSKNFFQTVIDNAKQEFKKNKEMKESIAKFKAETQKLEESEALKQARKKFETIEEETLKSSTAIRKSLGDLKEKVAETVEEAQKSSEFVKKGMEITSKTATKAAETIQKSSQAIGQSDAFRQISEGVKSAKEEFDDITLSRAKHYKTPEKLMKRSELSMRPQDKRDVEADDESTGMVLHKDSRFYQSWQNFKDNNPYVNKLFDLKVKYDESDNVMVRATRFFTDKIGQVFGGMFTKTEMSEVLTEICKVDPDFNREKFIRLCEVEIIPNILECSWFKDSRTSLQDEPTSGRRNTANNDWNTARVDELIKVNRRVKLKEISLKLDFPKTNVCEIVHGKLGNRKVSARWVSKMLSDEHKCLRVEISQILLHRCQQEGDETVDVEPGGDHRARSKLQIKCDLMTSEHPSSPVTKKFEVQQSATKVMATMFWDSRGMILLDILPKGESVNADRYCETLDRLRHAVRRIRPGLLRSRVVLQHDNATPPHGKTHKEMA